ncbi:GAP family protein [Streptomyces sp. NPDC053755]|uniref:GAP family protein n=1 Tax=Streptomyces sp. NPDC053755 TaxID=3155815 RepID=UPI003443C708
MVSLATLVTVVVLAGSGGNASGGEAGPASWSLLPKLGLGVLFLLLGVKQWKDRPREGREAEPPGWMKAIDSFTPGKSAGLAAALAVADPENLVVAVGGAVSIAARTVRPAGRRSPPYCGADRVPVHPAAARRLPSRRGEAGSARRVDGMDGRPHAAPP